MDPITIREATPDDQDLHNAFADEHLRDNGHNGIFHSVHSASAGRPQRPSSFGDRLIIPLDAVMWRRAWLAIDDAAGMVVGELSLSGGQVAAELHRCSMSMGLLPQARAKGIGTRMLARAIAWARDQPSLVWMDLGVFDGNAPALALYRKMGFEKRGTVEDRFRIDGVSITDTQMVLRLRA